MSGHDLEPAPARNGYPRYSYAQGDGYQSYVISALAKWWGQPLSELQLREIESYISLFLVEQRGADAASTTITRKSGL